MVLWPFVVTARKGLIPLQLILSVHLTDDHSRVKVIPYEDMDEDDGSDYINASFMPVTN